MTTEHVMRRRHLQAFAEGTSLWRAYMDAYVQDWVLESPVIELGSGKYGTTTYHHLIPRFKELNVTSVDISATRQPTIRANLEQGIPVGNGSFKTCLVLNLLILIYDHDFVLRECARVLEEDGTIAIAVPFLARVSPHPHDFFRYSGEALKRMLSNAGFEDIQVTTCGAGAATAALRQVDFAIPRFLRKTALRVAWAADRIIIRKSGGKFGTKEDYPIGFLVTARKRSGPEGRAPSAAS